MDILNWEYYSSHFSKVDEDTFKKHNYYATALTLKKLVKPYEELTENEQTSVKDCICNVINFVATNENNISSVSNDGYSVSYSSKTKADKDSELNSIFDEWLGVLQIAKFICF